MAADKFEIYITEEGRKKIFVVSKKPTASVAFKKYAKSVLKCSEARLVTAAGWIYRGKLYFENPKHLSAKKVTVAYQGKRTTA